MECSDVSKSPPNCLQRVKAVILSLEKQQEINYNPVTTLILSYLKDIRDGKVPNHVIESYQEILKKERYS